MTNDASQELAKARQGFREMVQDRLPHLPAPAAGFIADAVFTLAGEGEWDRWPESVELAREQVEFPTALRGVIVEVRSELEAALASGEVGEADPAVLRAIVDQLSRYPRTADAPGD